MANLSSSTPHMEAAASRPDAPGGGLPGKVHGPRYLQLFKYAQGYDKWLIVLGMLGAAGEGVGPAVIYVVMDYLVNSFGSLQDDPSKMRKQVNKVSE